MNTHIVYPIGLLMMRPAAALDELLSYAVSSDSSTAECCENCQTLNWADNVVAAFDDVFDGWESSDYWDQSYVFLNYNVAGELFADSTRVEWGFDDVDNIGIDSADVAYLVAHGGHICSGNDYYSYFLMGDDEHCEVFAGLRGYGSHVLLGNPGNAGELKIALFESCQSAQYCVWNNDGYWNVDSTRLLMWAGFHGDSHVGSGDVDEMEQFAAVSRTNGLGANWLAYRYDDRGDLADDCPAAVIWGESPNAIAELYLYGGLDDWIDTGAHEVDYFYNICGCDPANGNPVC